MGFIEVSVVTYLLLLLFLARKNFRKVSRTLKEK
jgi:hypothetical protein